MSGQLQIKEFKGGPERFYFLHGFPGRRTKQNEDLAKSLHDQLGVTSIILYYPGREVAPDEFGFAKTLEGVRGYFKAEFAKYSGISLIGHSFGGYLGLRVADEFSDKIKRLILLSPLISFENANLPPSAIIQVNKDYSDMKFADIDNAHFDFRDLGRSIQLKNLIENLPSSIDVSIIQAGKDQITLPEYVQEARAWFKVPPKYIELDLDHSFIEDRDLLIKTVTRLL